MLARLFPLSLATPIAYYVFAVWYRGPDTSPAQHPVSFPAGVFIAAAIVSVPAGLALLIARRRGHGWLGASCIALGEIALAAALVPGLLVMLTLLGGALTGDQSTPRLRRDDVGRGALSYGRPPAPRNSRAPRTAPPRPAR